MCCNESNLKYRAKHGMWNVLQCEQCKIQNKAWNTCNVLYWSSVRYKTKQLQCAKCCHTILLSPLRCQSASVVQREDYTKLHSDARISQNSSETVVLGKGGCIKSDEYWEKFQTAFAPPPSFLENYVAIFYDGYGLIYARSHRPDGIS